MSIAQLATEHYRKHGRPFRIAVDEAGWRFNNLNDRQVYKIRSEQEDTGHYNPEKNLFFRICKLLRLNCQLLFVFDGPKRPQKRNRVSKPVSPERTRILKEMLDHMKIPYYEAPAEAEAECAYLQKNGVVDAVWSEDADTLVFGSSLLICDYRVAKKESGSGSKDTSRVSKTNTERSETLIRVYRSSNLQSQFGLNREGLVLFVMLVGGDYSKGIINCGLKSAMKAVQAGYGESLYQCQSQKEVSAWLKKLQALLDDQSIKISPFSILHDTLSKYTNPVVTDGSESLNPSCLALGWQRPWEEHSLRAFLGAMFNIWTKRFFVWLGPVLLVQRAQIDPGIFEDPDLSIKVIKQRNKSQSDPEDQYTTKLKFKPASLMNTKIEDVAPGEWLGPKDSTRTVPGFGLVAEAEVLQCIFDKCSKPNGNPPKPSASTKAGRKRKSLADEEDRSQQDPPQKRQPETGSNLTSQALGDSASSSIVVSQNALFAKYGGIKKLMDGNQNTISPRTTASSGSDVLPSLKYESDAKEDVLEETTERGFINLISSDSE
ncbi:hypothetical protein ABW19_dt0200837 [Dactylella cylindrospora]|nr:hypothetical protein ABW19_dt0200837 [Dactylella cylindrospora]